MATESGSRTSLVSLYMDADGRYRSALTFCVLSLASYRDLISVTSGMMAYLSVVDAVASVEPWSQYDS